MAFFGFLSKPNLHDEITSPMFIDDSEFVGLSALKNSDVFTAISIVATDVARFPLRVIDRTTGMDIEDNQLDVVLNSVTDENLSSYEWRFIMTVNAITAGNAYSRVVRDPFTKNVTELQFFRPSQVSVNQSDSKHPIYYFYPDNESSAIQEPAENVIHLKFFSNDGLNGRSPLESLVNEIKLQDSGTKTLSANFASGGFKSSILKISGEMDREAKNVIKNDFVDAQRNTRAGEPMVLDDTVEYTPLEMDTQLLQLINSNNYSTAQIAKALRVSSYRLAQNSPNQSVKQLSEDYLKNDLPFYFRALESQLELKVLTADQRSTSKIEVDTREITGLSSEEAARNVNNGLMTAVEARNRMGKYAPLDEENHKLLSRFQSSLNTVFMDKKEEIQEKRNLKGGDLIEKKDKSDEANSI